MKKLFMALALMLATSTSMAMDTLTNVQNLVDRTTAEKRIVAVVFTLAKDERAKPSLALLTAAEAANPDMLFLLAPLENEELGMAAAMLGVNALPTVIFSRAGKVVATMSGSPPSAEELNKVLEKVREMDKKASEAPSSTEKIKSTFQKGVTLKINASK